jgi:hypothetical protein
VTLLGYTWAEEPPQVPFARFSLASAAAVSLLVHAPVNVHRIRMAALDPGVVSLLEVPLTDFVPTGPNTALAWTPTDAQRTQLARYATPAGAHRYGTSIWFEDIVGHVSTPERLEWS